VAAGGGTAGVLVLLHRAACACLESFGCMFDFLCLWVVDFFLFPSRHFGALSTVPSLSGFSRGDLFWLLPRCFVRCGVGRGVARRVRCVAAGGVTAGVLVLVASCSACVAYECWLSLCLSVLVGCWLLFLSVASRWRPSFCSILEWLLTRRSVLVTSPLHCALRHWARRGAAAVVCGGGRRHGGRLGLGCIVQRVRGF